MARRSALLVSVTSCLRKRDETPGEDASMNRHGTGIGLAYLLAGAGG
jgi:hypothetical protein